MEGILQLVKSAAVHTRDLLELPLVSFPLILQLFLHLLQLHYLLENSLFLALCLFN